MVTETWFEDDAFWLAIRPVMFPPEFVSRAREDAAAIASLLELRPEASILDVCCGFGRFSLEFARMGHPVRAVDLCRPFLAEIERTAAAELLPVETARVDVRRLQYEQEFDAAVVLFTSLGYFQDVSDDHAAMSNVFRSLRPGGKILVDMYSVGQVERNLVQVYEGDNFLSLKRRALVPAATRWDWLWIDVEWQVATPEGQKNFAFGQRIYTAKGLQDLLSSRGFTAVRILGSYEGAPYLSTSDTVVVVGEKPCNP